MIGRRCRMRYGLGTITHDYGDGLFGVVADVGGWWLCRAEEVWLVDE